MFSYNFMVTTIRNITQELDGFAARYANQLEHQYVNNLPLARREMKQSQRNHARLSRIVNALNAIHMREGAGGRNMT